MVTLLGVVLGLIGGYWLGVLRARSERRDEKRDEAFAEIYKALSLFYRSLMAWTGDPSHPPITEPDTSIRDYCLKCYSEFLGAYYSHSIWLGKEADDLINEFARAGDELLNELVRDMDEEGRLPDGASAVLPTGA
jgi:hypothetical protein